jgi:glyoxylase-like metal-dependent hydrolase (beta-lactamase superfamily II)
MIMQGKGLSIHPLNVGTVTGFDKSLFTLRENQGVKIDIPCLAWVIRGAERIALVDTGPCDPDWAAQYHRPLSKSPAQELDRALAGIGLDGGQIDLVIFTHLHWDHCFNLELFPSATFHVQKRELEYALDPLPADRRAYEAGLSGIVPPWRAVAERIVAMEGEQEVCPGVRVMLLPGHTPGSQGVVVETADGPWIIAGDMVPLYENWLGGDASKRIPGGIYQNLFDYEASFQRMASFGDRLLPSHDFRVLERTVYP